MNLFGKTAILKLGKGVCTMTLYNIIFCTIEFVIIILHTCSYFKQHLKVASHLSSPKALNMNSWKTVNLNISINGKTCTIRNCTQYHTACHPSVVHTCTYILFNLLFVTVNPQSIFFLSIPPWPTYIKNNLKKS